MRPELRKQSDTLAGNPQTSEFFSDIAGILGKFNALMERLPAFYQPTHQITSFGFFTRSPEELSYPEAVLDYMMTNELIGIGVDITQEEDEDPITSFEFVFDNDTGQRESIYASRVVTNEDKKESTSKFEDSQIPGYNLVTGSSDYDTLYSQVGTPDREIPKIPNHQLNSFLFSLTGNTIDAMLARDDPYGHNIVDAATMTTSLANSAVSQVIHYSFELDSDGRRTIDYHMTKDGDRDILNNLVFRYETGSSRSISVTIDQDQGFSLSYQTTDKGENGGLNPLYPDEGDYIRLNEILDEELAKLGR